MNVIEDALNVQREKRVAETAYIVLWRCKGDCFKPEFKSKETLNLIRTASATVTWYAGIWFTHATPRYTVCTWLAIQNRLSTGDRMINWGGGINSGCVLCQAPMETRNHLFFSCQYSTEIWTSLTKELLKSNFTTDWNDILDYISNTGHDRIQAFLARYVFQTTIHSIWKERNMRRHGEAPTAPSRLTAFIDKQIRNRISSIRVLGDHKYEGCLQAWFATRV